MDMDYETFNKAVRSALNYLYEPDQLRRSPLAALLGIPDRIDAPATLQKLLISAIDRLKPASDNPAYAGAWQMHDLLYLRYVRGYAREEVAGNLGISDRQLSREQRTAIEALALILWEEKSDASGGAGSAPPQLVAGAQKGDAATDAAAAATEAAEAADHLWVEALPIDTPAAASLILQSVLELLAPLLVQKRVRLHYQPHDSFRDMFVPPNAVRQSLLVVLNWMIPLAPGQQITLAPRVDGGRLVVAATIPLPAHMARDAFAAGALPPGIGVLQQLLEHNGGSHALEATESSLTVSFSIPALAQIPVLMIDDNPDTIRLFERYLQETRYALVGATQPAEIERLVARHQPRIIILDVMMPEVDGWELLVRLRQYLDTTETIIFVCSILPLGDLARSLGANGFLQKPVAPHLLMQELNAQSAHLANMP